MSDLAAISHRISLAIANADAYCATIAAEVLRRDVAELQRLASLNRCCDGCPHAKPETATNRFHNGG